MNEILQSLLRRVTAIREKLTPRQIIEELGEKHLFGTRELYLRQFLSEKYSAGKDVSEIDYLISVGDELDDLRKQFNSFEQVYNNTLHSPYDEISRLKQVVKYQIEELTKRAQSKRTPKKIKTYKWQGSSEQREILYNELKENSYISETTILSNFEEIFSYSPSITITKPIIWNSGIAKELLYFILSLREKDFIPSIRTFNYEQIRECFIKPQNKRFEEVFKSMKTDIEDTISNDTKTRINCVISKIL